MSDSSQVERQLYILSMLSENRRGFTIEEILGSLHRVGIDVSRKTVERDIDYITGNFFVYESERDGKTVYFAEKYAIDNVSFTVSELLSLYFTREVISSYSGLDVGKTALRMLDRLVSNAPNIHRSYINTLNDMLKVNITDINPEKNINEEYLELIREAIAEKKSLQMEYYSFNNDETTKRRFDPYLLEVQEACWHVVGHCHLRNSVRDFRVSRIKSLSATKELFERPANFYEEYKKDRFDKLAGEEKVNLKVRFTGEAARFVKEYEARKADSIEEDPQGNILFQRMTTITPEIVKWIMGYGADAEVLEPENIKQEVKEQIERAYKHYEGK